jgi:hypothetical protein
MQIKTAIEWQSVSSTLKAELHRIGYNPDLNKMLLNISIMITELSKLEVISRRIKKDYDLIEPLIKINSAIKHLEQLILMAKLMQ